MRNQALLLSTAIFITACGNSSPTMTSTDSTMLGTQQLPSGMETRPKKLSPGTVIIKFKNTATMDSLVFDKKFTKTVRRIMDDGAYILDFKKAGLGGDLSEDETEALINALKIANLKSIDYIQFDGIASPSAPNDPQYTYQYAHPIMSSESVWNNWQGSSNTVIAIVDNGIFNHADLTGKILPGYDFISDPAAALDGDGRDSNPYDSSGTWHGLHVAGIAAAIGNNGLNVAGMNWNAKVLPVRVIGNTGSETDIADGIRWAAGLPVTGVPNNPHPAKIINASLSVNYTGACSPVFQNAINAVVSAGATFITAAGNNNAQAEYAPANCNNTITVGATTQSNARWSDSNFGANVDVSAPGQQIDSLYVGINGDSTQALLSGTSMAAPEVAGIASFIYELNTSATPRMVNDIITGSVKFFPLRGCAQNLGYGNIAHASEESDPD